jgi:hypothetical protein
MWVFDCGRLAVGMNTQFAQLGSVWTLLEPTGAQRGPFIS